MSTFDSKSEKPQGSTGGRPKRLDCSEWEAMLVDALDGALSATDSAAFEAHREGCVACNRLLDEAKRGAEWLNFLDTEPEVPQDLVGRILAKTSGTDPVASLPVAVAGSAAAVVPPGWLPGLERHAAQSRWMMTAAMAFFSIAFTLNLTGVRLNSFHLSDLKPTAIASSLTRQFYVADAHLVRYYDNLRFVYELESRVREIKQNTSTPPSDNTQSAPATTDKTTKPAQKKPNGGNARKSVPAIQNPIEPQLSAGDAQPIMAGLDRDSLETRPHLHTLCRVHQSYVELKTVLVTEARTGRQASGQSTMQGRSSENSDILDRTERSSI